MRAARACGGYSGVVWLMIDSAVTLAGTFARAVEAFAEVDPSAPAPLLFPFLASCIFWAEEGPIPGEASAAGWTCASAATDSAGALGAGPIENRHDALLSP